ncbi:hypothetical protein X777_03722, partial [Ooceraea biroi]
LEHNLPILLENVPLHIRRNMIYQHDGAPTHSSRNIRRFLDATYQCNREELHHRIVEAVASISPDMIRNAQQSLLRRARICIDANGAQFEHLL